MTWRELKEAISHIPEDQLDNYVKAWGECLDLTVVVLESAKESMYYNPDWGNEWFRPESAIDPEELPDCAKVCDRGYFYLWVEL